MGVPQALGFLVVGFGVRAVTRPEAVFCFLAGAVSFTRSGNGPSVPKTGPGSKGRPGVQRVAEKDDAHVLLPLKHELVLVFIEGNGQRSCHC